MKNLLGGRELSRRFLFLFLILGAFANFAAGQKKPNVELDENGIPILVKHLPDWENARKRAVLATNLADLQKAVGGERPILNEIEFVVGTESVTANYDKSRLVIVELPTPQMAIEADSKIQTRLAESPQANTNYRKIGNYVVFVFDASDEQTAAKLLDAVNYEKEVQWLGNNPYPGIAAERKEREYLMTTGGVIVIVVQTAALAILTAMIFGGLLGAFVFYHRRKQQTNVNAYTDAGGMVRLNLDEMTPQSNPSRLLEK